MTELDLRETLERQLGGVDVPPGDPLLAIARGCRRRVRRRVLTGTAAALALAGVAAAGVTLIPSESDDPTTARYASLGPLDFSQGARAYADPGHELHLAGRTFPAKDLDYLDTDATATSYGVVFFDRGRPMLLGADGEVRALVDGPVEALGGFHPTAKADSVNPWVAYATRRGTTTTLTVHDLATGTDVASTTVDCGRCEDLVIDAFDDGVAYVRTDERTWAWFSATGVWQDAAGPKSRIVDVRNGVVLYDGLPPSSTIAVDGHPLNEIKAPVDAQLTFDGRYVLDWSSRLRSTDGSPDLVLQQGPEKGNGFWAIDSDGSVLVAAPMGGQGYEVYDCAVPSGACDELGPLDPKGGDPEFIGVDM